MAEAPQQYVVQIPGLSDIIVADPRKAGFTSYQEAAKQILISQSPVPKPIQWVGQVMTWLDDAQDLLFTATVLAKPLLKKLPLRFLPGLGWILAASDLINLATAVLGVVSPGRGPKKTAATLLESAQKPFKSKLKKAQAFLGSSQWLPFLIQAPQASATLTGYGVQLGALVSAPEEFAWGAIQEQLGNKVQVKGPPPTDPVAKALRYMRRGSDYVGIMDVLTPEEHWITMAARSIALQLIASAPNPTLIDERADILAQAYAPTYDVWHPMTRAALAAEGIDPDGPQRVPVTADTDAITYGDMAKLAAQELLTWETAMKNSTGTSDLGAALYLQHQDNGEQIWARLTGEPDPLEPIHTFESLFAMRCVECNMYPPNLPSALQFEQLLAQPGGIANVLPLIDPAKYKKCIDQAKFISNFRGRTGPNCSDVTSGLITGFGGFESRPYS